MLRCVDTKLSQECACVVATPLVGVVEPTCLAGSWNGGRGMDLSTPCQEDHVGGSSGYDLSQDAEKSRGPDSCVVTLQPVSGGATGSNSRGGLSDSGGSGGGQSSDGKQQKSGSESSNSSSRQSSSGSRSGGGRKAGGAGSCSRSGSSDSSGDDDDDEDKRRQRRHGVGGAGKESKPKLVDDDDEATDSADEGVEDDATPNSMIMDFSPPQSNQSGSGTDHASKEFPGTFSQLGIAGSSHRPTSLTPTANHYEGKSAAEDDAISTPLDNQGATGTIAIETMAPVESSSGSVESSNAINMIVGYGVPASAPHQAALDKTPPGSELGTPTLDSPPPPLGLDKTMPLAIHVPMTPILSPALTLLPQVTNPLTPGNQPAMFSLLLDFTALPQLVNTYEWFYINHMCVLCTIKSWNPAHIHESLNPHNDALGFFQT